MLPELEYELEDIWLGEVDRRSRDYIRWVQRSLNRIIGAGLAVDGIRGPYTRRAIRSFQRQLGLVVDGIVGPRTEAALIAAGASSPPSAGTVPSRSKRGPYPRVNTPLPREGPGFYITSYSRRKSRRYGLPETIQALKVIGAAWRRAHPGGPRIGIGDISLLGGGKMPPHVSHQKGVDIDIRLMRNDGREEPVRYQSPRYSRALTQQLVNLIRANGVLRVKLILFNDPAVKGVRPWRGHDNHLHVRFHPPR